ncbi:MAG TPA: alkaline phosphatase family protein [Ferruginibacter sp.]|nr:alkaline phosphatase family protein [Ferruginibacter sp.]HMP19566.1 alkaline phosphatase family protein [Ferruginibacter sp.]
MKWLTALFLIACTCSSIPTKAQAADNIFVITIDGIRWQEIFKGADSGLLHHTGYVKDTSIMLQQYWQSSPALRRQRLLPFFWNTIQSKGVLMGNREYNNRVNVANLYKISYPGYTEMFTGKADYVFIPNLRIRNRRYHILQHLNSLPAFKGRVAAFCSWQLFPFILNEKENDFEMNAGYENAAMIDSMSMLINEAQASVHAKGGTRHDLLTFEHAKNYIEQQQPKVLFLGLGEADEAAHHGRYDTYLQKIQQADAMIAELWYYVQTHPGYKNKTAFIITTDHGRGRGNNWTTHGFWAAGSGETWMAMIGPGITATGELQTEVQVYQKQIAATMAQLLGTSFPQGSPIELTSASTEIPALQNITAAKRK